MGTKKKVEAFSLVFFVHPVPPDAQLVEWWTHRQAETPQPMQSLAAGRHHSEDLRFWVSVLQWFFLGSRNSFLGSMSKMYIYIRNTYIHIWSVYIDKKNTCNMSSNKRLTMLVKNEHWWALVHRCCQSFDVVVDSSAPRAAPHSGKKPKSIWCANLSWAESCCMWQGTTQVLFCFWLCYIYYM